MWAARQPTGMLIAIATMSATNENAAIVRAGRLGSVATPMLCVAAAQVRAVSGSE